MINDMKILKFQQLVQALIIIPVVSRVKSFFHLLSQNSVVESYISVVPVAVSVLR